MLLGALGVVGTWLLPVDPLAPGRAALTARSTGELPTRLALPPTRKLDVVAHSISGGHITTKGEFIEAQRQGATRIDTDTHLAYDRELVVEHDITTLIGPPEGYFPATLDLFFGIPKLEDAFATLQSGNKLCLDIKKVLIGQPRNTMLEVMNLLDSNPLLKPSAALWLGDGNDVEEFAREFHDVEVGLSFETNTPDETEDLIVEARKHGANAVSIKWEGLNSYRGRGLVSLAQNYGQYVYCWNLPDEKAYREAAKMGVNAITVDNIPAGVEVARDRENGSHLSN